MTDSLPQGFAALEPFVAQWAVEDTAQRCEMRGSSTQEEREAFFAAATPLLDAALEYLDGQPLHSLAGADARLMKLMLALAHVALAVEIQGMDEEKGTPWRKRMKVTRSSADAKPSLLALVGETGQ